jgi:hypothetical protein
MDGFTPNLTHGIKAKDVLPPVEKLVMQLVQQWGLGSSLKACWQTLAAQTMHVFK